MSWFPWWPTIGFPSAGGPLVTGSGVVFIGAAMDNYIRAFDVASGHTLDEAKPSRDCTWYVIGGEAELLSRGKVLRSVGSDSAEARYPLSQLNDRFDSIRGGKSDARLLRVDRARVCSVNARIGTVNGVDTVGWSPWTP